VRVSFDFRSKHITYSAAGLYRRAERRKEWKGFKEIRNATSGLVSEAGDNDYTSSILLYHMKKMQRVEKMYEFYEHLQCLSVCVCILAAAYTANLSHISASSSTAQKEGVIFYADWLNL